MPDKRLRPFAQAVHPAVSGGARASGAAHVSRVSHSSGGGHVHAPTPPAALKGQMAQRYWAADDPNHPRGGHMPRNVPLVHPVFQNIDFPEYEFREFPKMLYPGAADPYVPEYDGKGLCISEGFIVNDEDEEAQVLAGRKVVRDVDEKARLIALAGVDGVTVDKRWSVAKLVAAIEEAGFDASADPFE